MRMSAFSVISLKADQSLNMPWVCCQPSLASYWSRRTIASATLSKAGATAQHTKRENIPLVDFISACCPGPRVKLLYRFECDFTPSSGPYWGHWMGLWSAKSLRRGWEGGWRVWMWRMGLVWTGQRQTQRHVQMQGSYAEGIKTTQWKKPLAQWSRILSIKKWTSVNTTLFTGFLYLISSFEILKFNVSELYFDTFPVFIYLYINKKKRKSPMSWIGSHTYNILTHKYSNSH